MCLRTQVSVISCFPNFKSCDRGSRIKINFAFLLQGLTTSVPPFPVLFKNKIIKEKKTLFEKGAVSEGNNCVVFHFLHLNFFRIVGIYHCKPRLKGAHFSDIVQSQCLASKLLPVPQSSNNPSLVKFYSI